MIWEAAVWSLLGVGSPLLAQRLEERLAERLGEAAWALPEVAFWLHGLLWPFAAVLTGAVPANFLGLFGGGSPLHWVGGALLMAGLYTALWVFLRHRHVATPAFRYDRVVLDEPRWALYRGSGRLLLADPALGTLLGLLLAVLEWGLSTQIWKPARRRQPSVCLILARTAGSSLAFALTMNLWLTVGFQLAWLSLLDRQRGATDG